MSRPALEIERTKKIKNLALQLRNYIDDTDVMYDSGLLDDAMEHAQEIIDIIDMMDQIAEGGD